jgi:hypothetical protein
MSQNSIDCARRRSGLECVRPYSLWTDVVFEAAQSVRSVLYRVFNFRRSLKLEPLSFPRILEGLVEEVENEIDSWAFAPPVDLPEDIIYARGAVKDGRLSFEEEEVLYFAFCEVAKGSIESGAPFPLGPADCRLCRKDSQRLRALFPIHHRDLRAQWEKKYGKKKAVKMKRISSTSAGTSVFTPSSRAGLTVEMKAHVDPAVVRRESARLRGLPASAVDSTNPGTGRLLSRASLADGLAGRVFEGELNDVLSDEELQLVFATLDGIPELSVAAAAVSEDVSLASTSQSGEKSPY